MSSLKKIAVFTSIRSEYGLLSPLLKMIRDDQDLELQLVVGGAHLLVKYGHTVDQITKDGFDITYTCDFLNEDGRADYLTRSLSTLQQQIGDYLMTHKPDLMIMMGDRFELMPVATACTVYSVPIAHISGGEITEGAIDNQIRHALTKLSHLHFPASEYYKHNVMQMGEEEWRICASGEPGLDLLNDIQYIPKKGLYEQLQLDLNKELIICTFHPETISNRINAAFVENTLRTVIQNTNYQVLVTAANFDNGGMDINTMLEQLPATLPGLRFVKSLGQLRYYSILKCAALMLGNSSSGLLEAQSFELPVINVGNRQEGRTANPNVLNCAISEDSILEAIKTVASSEFKKQYTCKKNIFGDGTACKQIVDFIKQVDVDKLLYKRTILA